MLFTDKSTAGNSNGRPEEGALREQAQEGADVVTAADLKEKRRAFSLARQRELALECARVTRVGRGFKGRDVATRCWEVAAFREIQVISFGP